jgi:hypothetical protein
MMNSADLTALKDFDTFFYYGRNKLDHETKSDVFANLVQPTRSLFYSRSLNSAGVSEYENNPISLALYVSLPYAIVKSLSKRNQYVGNGENGTKDRRVAVSQSSIGIENKKDGNVDVTILYVPLSDLKQTELQVPLVTG